MDILIRGAAVGIAAAVIGLAIKKSNPEMALLLSVAAGVLILFYSTGLLSGIKSLMDDLTDYAGLSPAVVAPVLRSTGIAIIGKLASDICKDAGQTSSASAIELIASAAALYVSIPLMRTVIQMLRSFM